MTKITASFSLNSSVPTDSFLKCVCVCACVTDHICVQAIHTVCTDSFTSIYKVGSSGAHVHACIVLEQFLVVHMYYNNSIGSCILIDFCCIYTATGVCVYSTYYWCMHAYGAQGGSIRRPAQWCCLSRDRWLRLLLYGKCQARFTFYRSTHFCLRL